MSQTLHMKNYHHLNTQERAVILLELDSGSSLRQIAHKLNRHPSTLSRELKRNQFKASSYCALVADKSYRHRRTRCVKPHKLQSNQALIEKVKKYLIQYKWSPEQISASLGL